MCYIGHTTLSRVNILVDLSAEDNFINLDLETQTNVPIHHLADLKEVSAVNGDRLSHVTHKTDPTTLILSGNHHKSLQVFCNFFTHVSCFSGVS